MRKWFCWLLGHKTAYKWLGFPRPVWLKADIPYKPAVRIGVPYCSACGQQLTPFTPPQEMTVL